MRFPHFLPALVFASLLAHSSRAWAVPGDEHWAPTFGTPGPSNTVYALTVRGDNDIYATGFWSAGPVSTNNWIEHWDGSSWSALPGLFTGSMPIFDSIFVGNDLYVCGVFSGLDGVPVRNVARWNGQNWNAIGDVRGLALCLATDNTNLYLGGTFTNIGGVAVTNIARWDGQTWSGMGDGLGVDANADLSAYVYALHWKEGLYAGGLFTNSGSATLHNLAKWDGAAWTEIGGGVDGAVYSLGSGSTDVYVGGNFQSAGGTSARSIARWDGGNWFPLGSGLIGNVSGLGLFKGPVFAIGVMGTDVIAGGTFTNAGGGRVSGLARWDGLAWSSIGAPNDTVDRIRISGTNIYFGGFFTQIDGLIVNHVARWDGSRFYPLGRRGRTEGSVFPGLRSLATGQGRVYAGGLFTAVGNIVASRIACWDGTNWSALGSGMKGVNTGTGTAVNAIAVDDAGNVYAGGVFTNAGGVAVNNIARWDGAAWNPMGDGIPGGTVSAIATRGNEVFVGGTFTLDLPGGDIAFNVARWDGSQWSSLPGGAFFGTIGNFFVSAIAIQGSDVYLGGSFVGGGFSGGVSTNVIKNDGTDWVALGMGVNSNVNAIAIIGNDVYAGGRFTRADGLPASRIARWDGNEWHPVGTGVTGTGTFSVSTLAAIGTQLYAGGSFTNAGGVDVNKIAKWNGFEWSALGSGVSRSLGAPSVLALAAINSDLFVGGNFEGAGGKPSFYIGQWNESRDFDFVPFLRLSKPIRLSDGTFRFSLFSSGVPSWIIEASSDLTHWTGIQTNTFQSVPVDDPEAANLSRRFYRARTGPP